MSTTVFVHSANATMIFVFLPASFVWRIFAHFFRLTRLLSFPTNTMKRTRKSGAEQLASVDVEVAVLLHALTSGVGVRAALTRLSVHTFSNGCVASVGGCCRWGRPTLWQPKASSPSTLTSVIKACHPRQKHGVLPPSRKWCTRKNHTNLSTPSRQMRLQVCVVRSKSTALPTTR